MGSVASAIGSVASAMGSVSSAMTSVGASVAAGAQAISTVTINRSVTARLNLFLSNIFFSYSLFWMDDRLTDFSFPHLCFISFRKYASCARVGCDGDEKGLSDLHERLRQNLYLLYNNYLICQLMALPPYDWQINPVGPG
jgi:hypothetical protein